MKTSLRKLPLALAAAIALSASACGGPAEAPKSNRPPQAEKWYQRALGEFRQVRIDAAHDSTRHALDIVPADEEVRLLSARVALARLEFAQAITQLRGIKSSAAASLRGRAYWYDNQLDKAADELEMLLADPEVVDPWAKEIVKLARRGTGRKPFAISGALLASVDMPRAAPNIPYFLVPLEIDGDSAIAMVATGTSEVVLDSATRREPSWVSLRFGRKLEVKDVPAVTQDLSALSHRLGVPIKALLGANFLRQVNATVDRKGRQFVARSFVPPPPPVASRIDLFYLRGGGMVMGGALQKDARAALYVDSSMSFPLALDSGGWGKAGVDLKGLTTLGNGAASAGLKGGTVPMFVFGTFKLPEVEAVYGPPIEQVEKELEIDVDGAVGAGLLADFRLTFSDAGRVLWVEQLANLADVGMPGLSAPIVPGGLKGDPRPLPGAPKGAVLVGPGGALPTTPLAADPVAPDAPAPSSGDQK